MEQIKRLFLSFALILTSSLIYAQTEVTGTVLDELGEGAIGATVVEKGTSNGAMTDIDGNFKLKVQPGATLVISYVGYQTMEVAAENGMKVTLQEDSKMLQEVVVTGYTTQRKVDLTGAISTVNVSELAKQNENNQFHLLKNFLHNCKDFQ